MLFLPKNSNDNGRICKVCTISLGLDNLFSSNADFSGIADQNVNVDTILQKTKLELDENGTKAAAVTAVTMECMSAAVENEPIIKIVELTRPFAFLIYDRSNDEILFIGKVTSIS
ncbi:MULTISPECIES: serpin family protein [unclassified Blautia]|uniref:serpin family protein n=1 Tax=unclassified Blautia TaxID=2648079 RepID=UPI003F8A3C9D